MKYTIFAIIMVLTSMAARSQQKITFKFNNHKIDGVIFSQSYVLRFKLNDVFGRFTPNRKDIERCESYLLTKNDSVTYLDLYEKNTPDTLSKNLKFYKRQYVGFINSNKDSIVVIQFLNFESKKRAENEFKGWENNFIVAFDGFYEKNMMRIDVNLSKKVLSIN